MTVPDLQSVDPQRAEMKFVGKTVLAVIACLSVSHGQETGDFLEEPCGRSPKRNRIVGGHIALIGRTPWMALISDEGRFKCGGSLITNRFVLSAAHCLNGGPLKVRLGEYDRNSEQNCRHGRCIGGAKEFDVDATFLHQDYNQERHDIGLLRLATRVQYTDDIRPICVLLRPSVSHLEDYIVKFSAYGWGITESRQSSQILRKTTLYNLDRNVCKTQFPAMKIDRDHICAERTRASTCNGDSGGPLCAKVVYHNEEKMILFGIVSFGREICENATVFTNVMAHLDWIQNIVRIGGAV